MNSLSCQIGLEANDGQDNNIRTAYLITQLYGFEYQCRYFPYILNIFYLNQGPLRSILCLVLLTFPYSFPTSGKRFSVLQGE